MGGGAPEAEACPPELVDHRVTQRRAAHDADRGFRGEAQVEEPAAQRPHLVDGFDLCCCTGREVRQGLCAVVADPPFHVKMNSNFISGKD